MSPTHIPGFSSPTAWVTTHWGAPCGHVIGGILDTWEKGVNELLGQPTTRPDAHRRSIHIAEIKHSLQQDQNALYPTDTICCCSWPRKPARHRHQ